MVEARNTMTIASTMGESKVIMQEQTDTLQDSMYLVVRFFQAEGFSEKTIKEAFLEVAITLDREVDNL